MPSRSSGTFFALSLPKVSPSETSISRAPLVIVEGTASANFDASPAIDVSPLAHQLFSVDGVEGVFLAANFATVSKCEDAEWVNIAQPIVDVLKKHLGSGEPALGPGYQVVTAEASGSLVKRICRVLDEEIRPAVARDGGDILFVGFREGVVELHSVSNSKTDWRSSG